MKMASKFSGFTLIEVLVGTAIFLLFALGIYGAMSFTFKSVYQGRLITLENSLLDQQLEAVRNVPYGSIGEVSGIPAGVLPHIQTLVKNGVSFTLTTTVRNIDDPYDGTLGGTPNDAAPADYKLVELSIICNNCDQHKPIMLSTRITPKGLEGASQNGALFVNVFDASGLPIQGANVRITNASTTPPLVIDDVTDNEGNYRLIDAPTGTLAYAITISKSGYSSDYTVSSTASNPNPAKPPSNVVSQAVTNISFSIDHTGNVTYHTLNSTCAALGNIPLAVSGSKLIGQNPTVYKYQKTITTDGSGNATMSPLEWDDYNIGLTNTAYDLGGTIPLLPFALLPGATQDASVILVPHTANSLLVSVIDAGTKLPLSDAAVELTNGVYDSVILTGLGYTRQTDWSGGSGQANFINATKYFFDSGTMENSKPAGDIVLKKTGNSYAGSGWLESSTFDLGTAVNFNSLIVTPSTQSTSTGIMPVRLQMATSDTSTPASWNFLGPDGTDTTYYTPTSTLINSIHNGSRYLRYRLFLSTDDARVTPQVGELAFTYTSGCTPPGQSFFSGLSAGTYTLSVNRAGYTPLIDANFDVNGQTETIVQMSPN